MYFSLLNFNANWCVCARMLTRHSNRMKSIACIAWTQTKMSYQLKVIYDLRFALKITFLLFYFVCLKKRRRSDCGRGGEEEGVEMNSILCFAEILQIRCRSPGTMMLNVIKRSHCDNLSIRRPKILSCSQTFLPKAENNCQNLLNTYLKLSPFQIYSRHTRLLTCENKGGTPSSFYCRFLVYSL